MKRISIALLAVLMVVATGAQAAGKTGWYVGGGIGWNQFETKQDTDMLSGTDTNQRCIAGDTAINGIYGFENGASTGGACYDLYQTSGSTFKETAFGLGAFVGWEFIPNWSVELQYVWLGSAEENTTVADDAPSGGLLQPPIYSSNDQLNYEQELNVNALNLVGRYHWAISPKWGLNFVGGWSIGKAVYEQSVSNLQPQDASAEWYRSPEKVKDKDRDNGYIIGFGTTINTTEHTFVRIEYNYYGFDFNDRIKSPGRVGFDIGYQF